MDDPSLLERKSRVFFLPKIISYISYFLKAHPLLLSPLFTCLLAIVQPSWIRSVHSAHSYTSQDLSQDHFVSATTHMTTAMSSWKVLASARLVRLASAPTCQTSAPGMLLLTRSGSTRASFAKNEHQQNKNDRNNKNGQKAAIALASATALALKVYYDKEG